MARQRRNTLTYGNVATVGARLSLTEAQVVHLADTIAVAIAMLRKYRRADI
jgi:hypothetical protein